MWARGRSGRPERRVEPSHQVREHDASAQPDISVPALEGHLGGPPVVARPSGHPTIADVAKLAGVSRSTVSNALNGRHQRLSAATSARVQEAFRSLGFVPDEVARQLRRGHAKTIGLLVPSVANPFWGEFVRAIEEAARPLDHSVLAASTDRDPAREQSYTDAMYRQGIRALIFGSSPVSISHLSALVKRNLHILVFDRRFRSGDLDVVDCVSVNNGLGGRLATEALVDLGHSRIGFLSARSRRPAGGTVSPATSGRFGPPVSSSTRQGYGPAPARARSETQRHPSLVVSELERC